MTDANLALGRYDPARFAGGTMRLDAAAAHDALAARVGGRLGLTTEMAALGVIEMVDENMANAARVHAIESGKTYEGRTLIAFGGGGPVHACRVAEKVGIRHVLVPSGAGVGSAIGFLRAPVGYEVVRSLYQRFSTFDVVAVNTLLADMEAEAMEVVAQGSFGAPITQSRIAYMRYVGQGHEIPVPLPSRPLGEEDVPQIRAAYDTEYTRFYDRPVPGSDVEIMSYAVRRRDDAEGRSRHTGRRRRCRVRPGRRRRRARSLCATPPRARSRPGRSMTAPRSRPACTSPAPRSSPRTKPRPWSARAGARR